MMNNLPKEIRQCSFEADYKYISSKSTQDELPVDGRNFIGKLYADRFGRERDETYTFCSSKWELTFIDIWDTINLKSYALSVQNKAILFQESLDPNTYLRVLDIGVPGITAHCIPRHYSCEGEDLGVKQIEGISCKGSRRTYSDNIVYQSGVIECWYSDLISYVVLVKAIFDNTENIFQLYNIQLEEPNEELFTIPPDYKQAELSYRECSIKKNDDTPFTKSDLVA